MTFILTKGYRKISKREVEIEKEIYKKEANTLNKLQVIKENGTRRKDKDSVFSI